MVFGNPAAERAAIETTYEDTATISRVVPETGDDKITKRVPQVMYSEIICSLSYSGGDNSKQTEAHNKIEYDAVIFMAPELVIHPGDSISLHRFGRDNPGNQTVLNFKVVGRPPGYATHQQVKVKDGDLE